MSAMDNHIVNVMIPTLSRQFHSPLASVQWTTLGYVLSLAVFIPASGWFGDKFGTKRIFLIALAAFTVASAACGQAHSLLELVIRAHRAGRRRRNADAGCDRDAVPGLSSCRARENDAGSRCPSSPRADSRSADRRTIGHKGLVALGVLPQRADRDRCVCNQRDLPQRTSRPVEGRIRCSRVCALRRRAECAFVLDQRGCAPRLEQHDGHSKWSLRTPGSCGVRSRSSSARSIPCSTSVLCRIASSGRPTL